jgi:peptidoglycan-N-acetylglucosamine deacetylase
MTRARGLIKEIMPRWVMVHRLKGCGTIRVLLTFDDGPDLVVTPRVLDALKRYKVRAVFFVVAEKAERYPELVKTILNEGHIVANHTYSHPHDQRLNFFQYRREIQQAQTILQAQTGYRVRFFRPPCGAFNLVTFLAAKSLGLKIVLWSNGGGEWAGRQSESADDIARALKLTISDGQIVLLHDNNDKVPAVLDAVLPFLQEKGYDLANAVSEILDGI